MAGFEVTTEVSAHPTTRTTTVRVRRGTLEDGAAEPERLLEQETKLLAGIATEQVIMH